MQINKKKLKITLILLILICFITSFLPSCRSNTNFGNIVFSDSINTETLEPIIIKNIYDTDINNVFAVIEYSYLNSKDFYYFSWTNLDLSKVMQTKLYTSERKDPKKGFIVSVMDVNKIPLSDIPGKYKVEFFYNNKLITNGEFEILKTDNSVSGL